MSKEKTEEQPVPKESVFTKEQFLQSRQRSGTEKDILSAVLDDGKLYTLAEVEKLISEFNKRVVK